MKILDRTAVILEIFAQHAQSREGQLQVELGTIGQAVQLTYSVLLHILEYKTRMQLYDVYSLSYLSYSLPLLYLFTSFVMSIAMLEYRQTRGPSARGNDGDNGAGFRGQSSFIYTHTHVYSTMAVICILFCTHMCCQHTVTPTHTNVSSCMYVYIQVPASRSLRQTSA